MMVVSLDCDKIQIYWGLFTVVYKDLCVKEWRSGLEEGNLAGFTAEKPQESAYPYKVISFLFLT